MIEVPTQFMTVEYAGARYPGSGASGLQGGANCQQFAYELLRHFGLAVPDFRSSELWEDTLFTFAVDAPEPLDLLLFGQDQEAYGAHVAVYLGDGKAIHLSKEIGRPAIWDLAEFGTRMKYGTLVGIKRVRPTPVLHSDGG